MNLPAIHTTFFDDAGWWQCMAPGYELFEFEQNNIRVSFPYIVTQKAGVRFLRNPHLTPYVLPSWQGETTPALQQTLLETAIEHLPSCQVAEWHWHPACGTLKVPGFTTEQHHTRCLTLQGIDALWMGCKPSLQRQIKKGKKSLQLGSSFDASVLFKVQRISLARHQKASTIPLTAMEQALHYVAQHQQGHILTASLNGNVVAAIFVVWDKHTTYYLGGGTTREGQAHGAMSYLLWQAIEEAVARGGTMFDFEGSRHEGIDRFFSQFGAEKVYYSVLVKNTSLLHKLYRWFSALKG